jgi:hypothetical protein
MLFTQGSPKLRQAQICPRFSPSAVRPSRQNVPQSGCWGDVVGPLESGDSQHTIGSAPRRSTQFGKQYARPVPKSSLDELLVGLGDVLQALTASEGLWLERMRELRSGQPGRISLLEAPPTPLWRTTPARRVLAPRVVVAPGPVEFPPNAAFAPVRDADPRAFDTPPRQGAKWPTASGSELVEPAVGKRDYDFFGELDQKLIDLQGRGVGSRES